MSQPSSAQKSSVIKNPYSKSQSSAKKSIGSLSQSTLTPPLSQPTMLTSTASSGTTPPASTSKTTTSAASSINPYSKAHPNHFLGGSEMARQRARRQKHAPAKILTPLEQQRLNELIPTHMNAFERFFATLLRTTAKEYYESNDSSNNITIKGTLLWQVLCQRAGVPVLTQPLATRYAEAPIHFNARISLLLEEARASIAQALTYKWKDNGRYKATATGGPSDGKNGQSNVSMIMTVKLTERTKSNGHSKLLLYQKRAFSHDETTEMRVGSLYQIVPRDSPQNVSCALLGVMVSGANDYGKDRSSFQVMCFRELPSNIENAEVIVSPLGTLISEMRSFEAMTARPERIGFLSNLLGNPTGGHVRFDAKSQGQKAELEKNNSITKYFAAAVKAPESPFKEPTLGQLNASQEKAATMFLQSPVNTISLVQGPPGTGKTSLIVSIMQRYLCEDTANETKRRLLVCAPTNRAITVLAARFIKSLDPDQTECRPIMVGDGDKLLADEKKGRGHQNQLSPSEQKIDLSSIFLYTWIQHVMDAYRRIHHFFAPRNAYDRSHRMSDRDVYLLASSLYKRLEISMPGLPHFASPKVLKYARDIAVELERFGDGGPAHDVVTTLDKLLKELALLPPELVQADLLANANVIFCTLASAGGQIMKATSKVDDLIVDEASAATEPLVYIPFHLRPNRLLCVGDPLQLPATIISRKAVSLGYSKSLQERLMYDNDFEHVMLDVQYRMNPAISEFPSARFYGGKIQNGPNVQKPGYLAGARLLDGRPYVVLQVAGVEEQSAGGSHRNEAEARCIVDLLKRLEVVDRRKDWNTVDHVRVITFYQAQVALIKRLLFQRGLGDKIVVATVDSSQGCEADIVLVSFVRGAQVASGSSTARVGFLTDDRRMNVALTRAKFQLICVGNVQAMEVMDDVGTVQALAKDAGGRGVIRSPADNGENMTTSNVAMNLFYKVEPSPKRVKLQR